MGLENGLYTKMSGTAAITALVSTRIYPNRAPQSAALPYITYQRITGDRIYQISSPFVFGIARPVMQIDCWSTSYLNCRAIFDAVRVALNGVQNATWDTISIYRSKLENDFELYEPPTDKDDIGIHRVTSDWEIYHGE